MVRVFVQRRGIFPNPTFWYILVLRRIVWMTKHTILGRARLHTHTILGVTYFQTNRQTYFVGKHRQMMANVSEHDRKANVLYFPGIEAKVREHPVRLFPVISWWRIIFCHEKKMNSNIRYISKSVSSHCSISHWQRVSIPLRTAFSRYRPTCRTGVQFNGMITI